MGNVALEKAIDYAGSQQRLAKLLDISDQAVSKWRHKNVVPLGRCLDIERVTQGRVTRLDLRPNHFGKLPEPRRKIQRPKAERARAD